MRDQHDIDTAQCSPRCIQNLAMTRIVVDIQHADAGSRAAGGEVGRNCFQAWGLAAEQVDGRTACGVASGGCFGNGRGGSDNKDALHVYSVTRRQKPEEKRGSR